MRLLFILVLLASVCAENCPVPCECHDYPRDNGAIFTRVTCSGNVTHDLPATTAELVLRNVLQSDLEALFESLSTNVACLPHLASISVTEVAFPDSSDATLSSLDTLRSLGFSYCKFANQPFAFANLTSLQSLDLSRNELKIVEYASFRTLAALEVLNLSANAIDTLYPDSFSGLSALKSLDLTENNLSAIHDNVLIPLVSLQHLNLSRNRLEVLNEACFSSLLHLQQLDVSWNRLARVAPGSLQLPSLARLLLAGNPKLGGSRQPALLVGTGRKLQTVDASQTGLKQVPAALTHSIRTLRLAGNSIKSVNCGDLDSYPLLQLLDFASNDLEQIEDDAMGRLDSLSVLYLADNNLSVVPRSLPERLRVLHMERNKIARIQSADLQGLPLLEVLLLGGNRIKVVQENSFSQLSSLETLDLSRNPISILTAGTLSGPIQLRVLRLSNIEAVPPAEELTFPLSSPEHLITLDMSSSPGLARQLLADTAALAAARELQELDLSNAELGHIRSDVLHFLPQLRILRLHGNPLNCTDLQWLAFWMRRQDDAEYRNVACSSPPELWGTLLVDLQDSPESEPTVESINQTKQNNSQKGRGLHNNATAAELEIPDGISVYNASGNTSSAKLGEMSDDGVSTANYTTENLPPTTPTYNPRAPHNNISTTSQTETTSLSLKSANEELMSSNAILNALGFHFKNISAWTRSYKSPPLKETYNVFRNKSDYDSFKSEAVDKKLSANPHRSKSVNEPVKVQTAETGAKGETSTFYEGGFPSPNEQQENVTAATGEMSMYSGENHGNSLAHPGMLILAVGVVGAAAALVMVTSRISRLRRRDSRDTDFEVSSLPSVTELW